ncbi:MAG: zf-HC2 domain-containing protein [Firmicutes bacterium]|nr:zf-HC2 domain-containing protein [Bacillota bacterium]
MSWTCEHVEQRLSEYLDRLLPPTERAEFAAHVEGCPRCRPLVEHLGGVVGALHRLVPLEPPPRLVHRILEQTSGAEAARGWRRRLPGWLLPVFTPRLAMGAVTAVIAFLVTSQALGISWSQVTLADLHPSHLYRAADRRLNLFYARGVKFVNDLRVIQVLQSRLQPATPPEGSEPQELPPANKTSEPSDRPRQNHADEILQNQRLLAGFGHALPSGMELSLGRIEP